MDILLNLLLKIEVYAQGWEKLLDCGRNDTRRRLQVKGQECVECIELGMSSNGAEEDLVANGTEWKRRGGGRRSFIEVLRIWLFNVPVVEIALDNAFFLKVDEVLIVECQD